jgi:dephospho-CoA kinase
MMPARERLRGGTGIVLGITGMPGSGKGEVTLMASEMSIPIHSLGDMVREHFRIYRYGSPPSGIGDFADSERREHGNDIWARRLTERIEAESGSNIILIDGVRSKYEVDVFRDRWGDRFKLLAVHSSPGTRFSRLLSRGRNDDPIDRADFDRRDERELKWGLGNVIALSDIMLLNEGTLEDLRAKARDVLTILGWA